MDANYTNLKQTFTEMVLRTFYRTFCKSNRTKSSVALWSIRAENSPKRSRTVPPLASTPTPPLHLQYAVLFESLWSKHTSRMCRFPFPFQKVPNIQYSHCLTNKHHKLKRSVVLTKTHVYKHKLCVLVHFRATTSHTISFLYSLEPYSGRPTRLWLLTEQWTLTCYIARFPALM